MKVIFLDIDGVMTSVDIYIPSLNLGIEFEVISSQTDYENAHTEVTIDIEISAEAFVEKLETIVKEHPYDLELLGSVFDTEAQEGIFEQ